MDSGKIHTLIVAMLNVSEFLGNLDGEGWVNISQSSDIERWVRRERIEEVDISGPGGK